LREESVEKMREIIQQLSTLKALKISERLSADAVGLLATALKSNTTLTSIDLSGMYLIAFASRLTTAMLDTNIGDDGAKAIAVALESNTTLTSINLFGTQLIVALLTCCAMTMPFRYQYW
jgi:hypothetical protein